jgi:hypothetical protein
MSVTPGTKAELPFRQLPAPALMEHLNSWPEEWSSAEAALRWPGSVRT